MSNSEAWIKEGIYKVGDRCDIEQYKMLIRCSEKKDMSEWNDWWDKNRGEKIWLVGAELENAHLRGAKLYRARLSGAWLEQTNLQGANLLLANLQHADFRGAHLQDAILQDASLQNVNFYRANLQGVLFVGAKLQGADCRFAFVDGKTLISKCEINKNTDFTAVGLDSACIDPGLKLLLEYNIRRKRWREFYKQHRLLRLPVWPFWLMSDYGRSTVRIVEVFFVLASIFACVYWLCPGLLKGVVNGGDGIRGFLHALYFSVVTMTTLGFGDIYANPDNGWGQILLMVQVLLGYVLLGALITSFAVLFTSGGPAASTEYWKKSKTDKKAPKKN